VTSVEASIVSAVRAEDGRGGQLETASAVAVDIQFDKLPGRALDPVLEIAGATFRRYETRPGGVLRYIIASRELAEAGEAVLRWGPDIIVVADKLRIR
jgi:hypothetical protein